MLIVKKNTKEEDESEDEHKSETETETEEESEEWSEEKTKRESFEKENDGVPLVKRGERLRAKSNETGERREWRILSRAGNKKAISGVIVIM